MMTRANKNRTRKTRQRGYGVDLQKLLAKAGIEWHWSGYQYLGAGTQLQKRSRHQSIGQTGQTTRHRLRSGQDFDG